MIRINRIEQTIIVMCQRFFEPTARIALFAIYFGFGLLKIVGSSPASPLAYALTERTIGGQFFDGSFFALAVVECIIGVMFLIPRVTWATVALFSVHMVVVCSPLLLVPDMAWSAPFVPSLEGQYMIKNIALIAVVVGIIAMMAKQRTYDMSHA